MRRPSFAYLTVDIVTKGPENRYGERQDMTVMTVPNCHFDPGGSSEQTDHMMRTQTTATLYGPKQLAWVKATDDVIITGVRWQVVGLPRPFRDHAEIQLRRVEG